MASFATPQRRPHSPSRLVAAPIPDEKRYSAMLPTIESPDTEQPARSSLPPIPLYAPDAPHADIQEATPETFAGVMQARVAVKQIGPGFPRMASKIGAALPVQRKNVTGLPDTLKAGVEALSGIALDDVRVRYNSPNAAQIGAFAYAQGAEIHVGPGQEQHLPHEAWHVVQQKQGRVKPTVKAKGLPVNDDAGLEAEADTMGARAARSGTDQGTTGQATGGVPSRQSRAPGAGSTAGVIQGMFWEKTPEGKYIWHYGPVISAIWQAAPDEPYSHAEGATAYGVWLRKSALPSAAEPAKDGPKEGSGAPSKDATKGLVAPPKQDSAESPKKAVEEPPKDVSAGPPKDEAGEAAKGSLAPPKQDSAESPKKAVEKPPEDAVGEPPMDAGAPIKEGAVIEPIRITKVAKQRDPLSLEKIQAGVKTRPKELGETLMPYAVRVANELSKEYSLNIQDHDWIFPKVKGAAIIYFPQVDQDGGGQDAIGATVNYKGTAYKKQTPLIQQLEDEYGLEKKTTKTALSRMVSGGKGNNDLKRTGPAIKDDAELVMLRGALHESFGIGENGCTFFFLKAGADVTIVAVGAHVGDAKHYRLEYGAAGYPSKGAFMFP